MHRAGPRRLLATVLFTDIVGSTERAARLGDRGWKELVARHHAVVRHELRRFHGRELDTAGDGFFAVFDRPAEAIECATEIVDHLRPLDLQIRAGIHMGEAEVMGGKVGGLTVHVASRAMSQAEAGEILVTSTVHDVVAGADVVFADRGVRQFKGVPGEWRLYAVSWQPRELAPELAAETPGRRWLGWQMLAGAAVLGAALTAAAAFALIGLGSGPAQPLAQPDSAIRLDAATNAVLAVFPVGESPSDIATGDDTVWVLRVHDKLLTGIDVNGGAPRTKGLPGSPTGIAAGTGAVWIAFGYGASGASAGIVLRISTGEQLQEDPPIAVANGASAIAAGEGGVWVVNENADSLTKIDPETRAVGTPVKVGERPAAVTIGEGSVWVANSLSRSVWRVDPTTLAKTGEITLSDPPTSIAVGLGRAWVLSAAASTLAVIETSTNRLLTKIPLDQPPSCVAVGADAAWVGTTRNELLRIDPVSYGTRQIELPGPAAGVAVLGSSVWVTVQR